MLGQDSLLLRKNWLETFTNIFACLWKCYRSTVGYCVKRVMASETGKDLHDLPCSGCPVTAFSPEMPQRADAIDHKD
jgi:hypothetical protein